MWPPCAATTLCAFHFLSAAACVKLSQLLGWTQSAHMPWRGEGSSPVAAAEAAWQQNLHTWAAVL
jgi:hypothetical protein